MYLKGKNSPTHYGTFLEKNPPKSIANKKAQWTDNGLREKLRSMVLKLLMLWILVNPKYANMIQEKYSWNKIK